MTEEIKSVNLDTYESAFFARNLETIKAKTYDVQYPALKAMDLIPVSAEAGEGAESITYQQFDMLGVAKLINNFATDLPRSDIKGREFTAPIRSIGASYGYSIQEIRAARFQGRNLEQRKANAARHSIEQKLNKIGWGGDSEGGLTGLINNPNVTREASPATGTASATTWASKTAALILSELNTFVNNIFSLTKGVEQPNTLILPLAQYSLISTLRVDTVTPLTVKEFFLMNTPFIKNIEWANEMTAAGIGVSPVGAGADIMIAYDRSPDKLEFQVPVAFEQFAAQEKGLEFEIPCHARVGGVLVYYPLSISIMEGI